MNTTTLTQTSQTESTSRVEDLARYRGHESTHQLADLPALRLRSSESHGPANRTDPAAPAGPEAGKPRTVLLRNELGGVLRDNRLRQHRTLRDVAGVARVSLGYLSEVERGHKEASSELVASICEALEVPLWETLREVCERVAMAEAESVPEIAQEANSIGPSNVISIAS